MSDYRPEPGFSTPVTKSGMESLTKLSDSNPYVDMEQLEARVILGWIVEVRKEAKCSDEIARHALLCESFNIKRAVNYARHLVHEKNKRIQQAQQEAATIQVQQN